jgi:phospholipase A-2-activating protein
LIFKWSQNQTEWIKIGQVTNAIGSSHKKSFEGKEYDFIFDVDIQDGVPPLKLPYNAIGK